MISARRVAQVIHFILPVWYVISDFAAELHREDQ